MLWVPLSWGRKSCKFPSFMGIVEAVFNVFVPAFVEKWEFGHVELREKAWAKLPVVFRLNG